MDGRTRNPHLQVARLGHTTPEKVYATEKAVRVCSSGFGSGFGSGLQFGVWFGVWFGLKFGFWFGFWFGF